MSDTPRRVWIRTEQATDLAIALQATDKVDSITFHDDNGGIEITTTDIEEFGRCLPELVLDKSIAVTELFSEDDSLDSVFEMLMRIHRGEI